MVRDLWTAAEARHEKPQGFIFSPGCFAQGQDWEVKLLLFLSDHFHIWTPLVLVCVTANPLSAKLSGLCAESMHKSALVLQYESRDKYFCPHLLVIVTKHMWTHACSYSVKVLRPHYIRWILHLLTQAKSQR